MTLAELVTRWQSRREEWARLGASIDGGKVAAEIIADLESLRRAQTSDAITLREASQLGGLSVDRIQHLVAGGQIENVGRKHRPRIRRSDVPVKPGHSLQKSNDGDQFSERRRIAASIITGGPT